jgi:hypothetical protein
VTFHVVEESSGDPVWDLAAAMLLQGLKVSGIPIYEVERKNYAESCARMAVELAVQLDKVQAEVAQRLNEEENNG